ncbi:MAG: orotate phosphoribosyltransferase [Nanoarchaeota archaeon]
MKDYDRRIVQRGLEIKAIKLNPDKPFVWASGFQMPIYNDNRMFLFNPTHRQLITDGFVDMINEQNLFYDIIAGTSTSGIPLATSLSNKLGSPLIYIRDKPKDHGLKNQIEGIDAEDTLEMKRVLLIEDLISTGGSSVNAVQAIRNANGVCEHCFSIFNYGFKEAEEMFQGKRPYDKEKTKFLTTPCKVKSLLTYDTLLKIAKETGYINSEQEKMLEEWREDPFNWGEKHGFPKVEKTKQ